MGASLRRVRRIPLLVVSLITRGAQIAHVDAVNAGERPVVLHLSTLFPKGAPPSIPG